MNLEPAPRLPKWIFLAIDAGLLVAAFIIVFFAKHPYEPLPFISVVVCIGLAAIIGLIPFLIEYAADSAEYVQQERLRVNEQVQRLHAAAESLTRAAAQIKAVEEAVHKTAHAAENLPYRMQEKLAEFNTALAEKEESDREALEQELVELRAANSEQLKAVAEKIHKAATDWAALETATRKQLAAAEAAAARVQASAGDAAQKFEAKLAAALAALDHKLAAREPAPVVTSHPAPAPVPEPEPAPVVEAKPAPASIVESVAILETAAPVVTAPATEEAKPRKPRVPRKPREISPEAEPSTEPVESAPAEDSSEPAPLLSGNEEPAAPAEAAASSDGATRLLATAYIGIGNKLFIRGEGPGLSWDKGVPMQFVSIGKWGWATHDASTPVRCKLYKNDETAALSGEVTLEPGKHVEVTALF